jgi:hypothetical protein
MTKLINNKSDKKAVSQLTYRHLVTNGPDFDTPLGFSVDKFVFPETELPKGYQSTASVELKFYENDKAIKPESVVWTILSVQNKARAWNRVPGGFNGLAWGDSEVNGETDWEATPVVGGHSITTSDGAVKLTDIVGERKVSLKAEASLKGVIYTEIIKLTFGKGPLSVFTKKPSNGGMQWATACGVTATKDFGDPKQGDFTANTTAFPAAEYCGGTVYSGPLDITVQGSSKNGYSRYYLVNFSRGILRGHWKDLFLEESRAYSTTSNLPTVGQLLAVSAQSPNSFQAHINRKGAALAAGWPDDDEEIGNFGYWSGDVLFDTTGDFYASYINLRTGSLNYFSDVTLNHFIAVSIG